MADVSGVRSNDIAAMNLEKQQKQVQEQADREREAAQRAAEERDRQQRAADAAAEARNAEEASREEAQRRGEVVDTVV